MVKFTYDGKDYKLGFNRKTAVALQRQGFDIDKIDTQSLIMIPMLVHAAFKMNHSSVKEEKIDEIYAKIGKKDEFLAALIKSYAETCNTLFEDKENADGEDGNSDFVDWSAE